MIEKIDAKIKAYIEAILEKDAIDYNDFQALSSEFLRMHMLAEAKKLEEEKIKTAQRMQKALESMESMTICVKGE